VKLRIFTVLYISGIEIGRKFFIKIFSDFAIDRSLRHAEQGFQLIRILHGGSSLNDRVARDKREKRDLRDV
jgi:hypothetical protein